MTENPVYLCFIKGEIERDREIERQRDREAEIERHSEKESEREKFVI